MYAPIRPALYLNFLKPPLHPLVAFTRSSAGYRVNEKGLLESVGSGLARFNHWPFDATAGQNGAARGVLFHEARTNIVLRSEDLSNAAWTKTNSTVSANAIAAPDGATTADKVVEASDTAQAHRVIQGSLTYTAAAWTFSIFAKAGERTQVTLNCASGADSEKGAKFNLSTGAVISTDSGVTSSGIENYGNGWYRCWFTRTMQADASGTMSAYLRSGGSETYNGDGASGAYFWGADAQAGRSTSAYIPTAGSTVTRAAEAATVTLSSVPAWNATEFALYVAFRQAAAGAASLFPTVCGVDDGTGNNYARILSNGGDNVTAIVNSGGSGVASLAKSSPGTGLQKMALRVKANDFAAYWNGALVGRDTSGAVPVTPTRATIGSGGGVNYWNDHLEEFAIFPRGLTDAELQRLTAA